MELLHARLSQPVLPAMLGLVFLLLSGCAINSPQLNARLPLVEPVDPGEPTVQSCRLLLRNLDQTVRAVAVTDAETSKVTGFPYLRVNRHLQAVGQQIATQRQAIVWLGRLQALDQTARETEIRNLPARALSNLQPGTPASLEARKTALLTHVRECSSLLVNQEARHTESLSRIRAAAVVPDHYSTLKRAAGVYTLSSLGVAAGVRDWEQTTLDLFQKSALLPAQNKPTRITTGKRRAGQSAATRLLGSRRRDALGIPILTTEVKNWLLGEFAPTFLIEGQGRYDQAGTLRANADGKATIDFATPSIYTRVAFTRYQNESLIQLIYTIWFPERPAKSAFDIYAGKLDGLTVRLTLNKNGQPAVIDTIHACGCYHQFFHTAYAQPLDRPAHLPARDEWRFMPAGQLHAGPQDSLHVYIQSATHYVQKMAFEPAQPPIGRTATLTDDRALTRLVKGSGPETISLFNTAGLVAGTERSERWLLWPMGINSPGAMRQWGTHATAFVGRRHFDDADLIQSRFDLP